MKISKNNTFGDAQNTPPPLTIPAAAYLPCFSDSIFSPELSEATETDLFL